MSMAQRIRGRVVSASDLESLGKTAARLAETSGISLTEAAMRTLEPEGLNAEQIRRAVEHANINAVNTKFAQLIGDDRIVHIDGGPADPATVIGALSAHHAAPGARVLAAEYGTAPSYAKVASAVGEMPKVDVPRLQQKLAAAHDELVDMCNGLEFHMESKLAELRQTAYRASLEGASLCDLTLRWSEIDPRLAKVAAAQLSDQIRWGEKTAGRRVSGEHPVVLRFQDFAKVASDYHRAVEARRIVETQLAEVSGFLARAVC